MATSKPTYTYILQCSPASVGLTQAHPNYMLCSGNLIKTHALKQKKDGRHMVVTVILTDIEWPKSVYSCSRSHVIVLRMHVKRGSLMIQMW